MAEIPQHLPVNIEDEMKRSYIDYAMSVIIGRALPDVRDGLKPVHRRILFGMHEMGLATTSGYRKCAKIVGEVMGNFHPHGDAAIYDSLVRMAQEFSMRCRAGRWSGEFRFSRRRSAGGDAVYRSTAGTHCRGDAGGHRKGDG